MHKLKWLNGALAGLEFKLPAGETRIGGEAPDVALPLEADAQAVLTSDDNGVLLSAGGPVWVDGLSWNSGEALPFDRAIDVAGLAFVIGGGDDTLTMRAVPSRQSAPIRPASTVFIPIGVAFAVCAVLSGVGLMLWRPDGPARFDVEGWLAQELKAPALQSMHARRAADGSLVLSGRCASSKDVEQLRVRLREHGIAMHDESLCADTLRENVRSMLALNGYRDVDVRIDADSDLVEIRGPIVADGAWQRVVTQLQTLPGLRAWRVLNDRALWFDRLFDALSNGDLLDGVNIVMSGKTFIVSGVVDPARARALSDRIATFNRSSADGFTATWQQVPSLETASEWLPAPVVTVGGNADATYVVLTNGMRLQLGGVLPNGYAIVRLTPQSMSLRKEQRFVSVPLNL